MRAYLLTRWKGTPLVEEIDDVVQEVFVESFREGGVLEKADPDRPTGFRPFFYGVLRNVALRAEARRARRRDQQAATGYFQNSLEDDEPRLSQVFDRHWAATVMREAAALQSERAANEGPEAERRVELLRLRFGEGLPIREIAERWNEDPTTLHRQYATARREFRRALAEAVAFHHPGSEAAIEEECSQLLSILQKGR